MSAYLTNEEANEAFDKITNYYKKTTKRKSNSYIKRSGDLIWDMRYKFTPEFLDDNGINSIKPGALITDLSDIDGALA